jgi:hypothetical protein
MKKEDLCQMSREELLTLARKIIEELSPEQIRELR